MADLVSTDTSADSTERSGDIQAYVLAIDILNFRKGMWEKVKKRSHTPIQIYAFGAGSDDVMLHGTVEYVLKDDRKTDMAWAAKAHFTQEDGELKMDFYQVFLVSQLELLRLS